MDSDRESSYPARGCVHIGHDFSLGGHVGTRRGLRLGELRKAGLEVETRVTDSEWAS